MANTPKEILTKLAQDEIDRLRPQLKDPATKSEAQERIAYLQRRINNLKAAK